MSAQADDYFLRNRHTRSRPPERARSRYQWPDGKWRWRYTPPTRVYGYWVAADVTDDGTIPNRFDGFPFRMSIPAKPQIVEWFAAYPGADRVLRDGVRVWTVPRCACGSSSWVMQHASHTDTHLIARCDRCDAQLTPVFRSE